MGWIITAWVRSMNQEKLKFIPGDTTQVLEGDGAAAGAFESVIHVVGEEVWLARITVHGYRQDDAEALRDRVLWALEQPTVPTQWQYLSALDWDSTSGDKPVWVNLDNGGEAARVKGEGYEIRALYQKQPLKEV